MAPAAESVSHALASDTQASEDAGERGADSDDTDLDGQ
jgi:hypothetical protein